jgi:hypothetical protein
MSKEQNTLKAYDERGVAKDLSMRLWNFLVNAEFKDMEAIDILIETMGWLEAHAEDGQ